MDKRADEKKSRLLAALDQGMTMVHLDARRPGVIVPEHLRNEAHLLLNLSYKFDPPDLSVGEWGVRSTLSFQGRRFKVAVPWSALYAITSHVTKEYWMFPDDMPAELFQAAMAKRDSSPDLPAVKEVKEVGGSAPPVAAEAPVATSNDQGEREVRRGHLRLVK